MAKNFNPVIIYDGYCYLCSNTIRFLLKFDKKGKIKFTTTNSLYAKKLLGVFNTEQVTDSIMLLTEHKLHIKSTAIIESLLLLGKGFRIFSILKIIPLHVRDFVYDFIARNRYVLFGRRTSCHQIPDRYKSRFL